MMGLSRWKCTMQATSCLVAGWNMACRMFLHKTRSTAEGGLSSRMMQCHGGHMAGVFMKTWTESLLTVQAGSLLLSSATAIARAAASMVAGT